MREHVLEAIRNAQVEEEPWPHVIVKNVFPIEFYAMLLANLPERSTMKQFAQCRWLSWIVEKNRYYTVPSFWANLREELFLLLRKQLELKFGVEGVSLGAEILHDTPGYSIGPHTDTPDKLITGLFYLPQTDADVRQGTILYKCAAPDPTGKGHKFDDKVYVPYTITPYVPNSALFFLRSDLSYHGVRPSPVKRWILAFDVFKW